MANIITEKNTKKPFPQRVQHAAESWKRYTEPMRACRKQMLAHYANGWYQGGGGNTRSFQPINLIDRGVQIIGPFLVSNNPRVMIQPRRGLNTPDMKSFAVVMELALARFFEEIKLSEHTLRPVAIDSLFSMGITKTGTSHTHNIDIDGMRLPAGTVYCDRIDFDDYIGDVAARHRGEMVIEGHYYRLPEEYVKTSGLFKNYDGVKPDLELYGSTKPEVIAKTNAQEMDYHELRSTVQLMDIWLPQEQTIITLPVEGMGEKIMRTVEWDGPDDGPFDILSYRYFPSSVIPIPPVYTWLDINKTLNDLVVKMRDQAQRQKTIGLYNLANSDEAEIIKNSGDGEMVGVSSTDNIKELSLGGFNEISFPFVQYLETQYSKTGPNLDVIGGSAQQANTLGQEQMLQSNAMRALDDMVSQTYAFTKSIVRKIGWFLWNDPLVDIPIVKKIMGFDIERTFSEGEKIGNFFDYVFEIEPYSLGRMNPDIRYQKLMQLVSQIVLPTAQIAASQGEQLKVGELVKEFARYAGVNNVSDWWENGMPAEAAMNPYQPLMFGQGKPKSGQASGQLPQDNSSNMNNMLQQQSRAGGESSPPNGTTTKGM